MLISIFTPTYNREATLVRLYNSLCKQSKKNFEWILVDDGSTDNTERLCLKWIQDNNINIKYYKKDNGGKASAYNIAIDKASGELFTCVDSDDYLTNDAVETIISDWLDLTTHLFNNSNIIGLIYFRSYANGKLITRYNGNNLVGNLNMFYRKYGLRGDTMLVYLTRIVNKYPFPYFTGENFIPEAYIYDQLDEVGDLLLKRKSIYVCEYLPDGYTASIKRMIANNPKGYEAFIWQRIQNDKSVVTYMLDMIRFIAITLVENDTFRILKSLNKFTVVLLLPVAWIYYRTVYFKYLDRNRIK